MGGIQWLKQDRAIAVSNEKFHGTCLAYLFVACILL
jgi:hypothetical protein